MKKSIACLLTLCMMVALLAGCGSAPTAPAEEPKAEEPAPAEEPKAEEAAAPVEAEPEGEDEENYETGDASLDDPLNQDGIGEKELLVVSFGTSFNDNRRLTIGAIEKWLQTGFPEWSVRRAFTSQIIIDHVKGRDGEVIDNVGEALDRAIANGVKILVVQPTHLMAGFEYTDLKNELAEYADAFDQIVLSNPLLVTDEDFHDVAEAIVSATAGYDDGKTAICFMGHDDTEIGPDLRHARDGSGIKIKREGQFARRGQAEARRSGAEDAAVAVQRRENVHTVVGAADVHLDLEAVNAGEDGIVEGGSRVHNVECSM